MTPEKIVWYYCNYKPYFYINETYNQCFFQIKAVYSILYKSNLNCKGLPFKSERINYICEEAMP